MDLGPSTAAPGRVTIHRIPVGKMKHAPYNPRKRLTASDPEYQKIKRSIGDNGYIDPVIWNKRTGHIVGGHQRFAVLVAEFGATEVDCVVVDMPLSREKATNLALNKIAGEWDDSALAELLAELRAYDLDLAATGFDEDEVDTLIKEATAALADDAAEAEAVIPVRFQVVVTCKSERDQERAYEKMVNAGYACRLRTEKV